MEHSIYLPINIVRDLTPFSESHHLYKTSGSSRCTVSGLDLVPEDREGGGVDTGSGRRRVYRLS